MSTTSYAPPVNAVVKRTQSDPGAAHYIVSLLVPPFGILLGIVAAAQNRVGPALALWMTSIVAPLLWFAAFLLYGIASVS